MSKIYDALTELESNPFEPKHAAVSGPLAGGTAHGLTQELVEFEKLLFERVARLKVVADASETAVAIENRQAALTIEKLKSQILALDSRLKELKDNLESKEQAKQLLEKDLSCKLDALKSELHQKDQSLASRDLEVNALHAEVNRLREGIRGMVSMFNQQAQALGGQTAEHHHVAALAAPAMTEAQNSPTLVGANRAGMFVESTTRLSDGVDPSTLER